jgi:hypothetical protein
MLNIKSKPVPALLGVGKDQVRIDNRIRPVFHVHAANGQLKKELKRAFLLEIEVSLLNLLNGWISIQDKTQWIMYPSPEVKEQILKTCSSVQCIGSFQEYKQGAKLVVIRLIKDR